MTVSTSSFWPTFTVALDAKPCAQENREDFDYDLKIKVATNFNLAITQLIVFTQVKDNYASPMRYYLDAIRNLSAACCGECMETQFLVNKCKQPPTKHWQVFLATGNDGLLATDSLLPHLDAMGIDLFTATMVLEQFRNRFKEWLTVVRGWVAMGFPDRNKFVALANAYWTDSPTSEVVSGWEAARSIVTDFLETYLEPQFLKWDENDLSAAWEPFLIASLPRWSQRFSRRNTDTTVDFTRPFFTVLGPTGTTVS